MVESAGLREALTPSLRRQDMPLGVNPLELEVKASLVRLTELKALIGNSNSTLNSITERELRQSKTLRDSLTEFRDFYYFSRLDEPHSMVKKYTSKE